MNFINNQFQVIGTKIFDPNGQEFIVKGTNMFAWEKMSNVDNYLNTWGFNTIRVPNYLLGSYNQPHPEENDYGTNHQIVDAYTSQGAVVIFDAHDRIGSYYQDEEWEILKDYWRDMAREFKDNPYVWFNLHNEPGNATANPEQWVSYHRELIDIIRAEGANNLIVVDGEAWGQDYHTQTIANKAHEIMEGNENVLFSIHVYDQWVGKDIGAYFDTLHSQNIPLIVGEYGMKNVGQDTLPASMAMMEAAQEREIGRIVWVAKGDGDNDLTTGTGGHAEYFDGTNPEIMTDLGRLVWEDLQRVETLERLPGYVETSKIEEFTSGVFQVGATGEMQFDFLFNGEWTEGELAIFNLEGMEEYIPGTQEFVLQAAIRAISDSTQGYVLASELEEAALFSSPLPWEYNYNYNTGEYLGIKSFALNPGDRYGIFLVPNGTVAQIVEDPGIIWNSNATLPLFSMPEANPGFVEGQMVAVNDYNTFAFEHNRIDWNLDDGDYNDFVFQLQGVTTDVPAITDWINPERDWLTTDIGREILDYSETNYLGANDGDNSEDPVSGLKGKNGNLKTENNFLKGKKGDDTLLGTEEKDVLKGNKGNDSLYGNLGDDILKGEKDDDFLDGGEGNDTLLGGRGFDTLIGGLGDDILVGGKDDDYLDGGLGNDNLIGGKGRDIFALADDGGVDLVRDFETDRDVFQLMGSLKFEDLTIVRGRGLNSNDVIVSLAENDQLLAIISDVSVEELTIVDFI